MSWPWWAVLLAAAPVVVLAGLVLREQPLVRSAWIAVALASLLGVAVFGLNAGELAVGIVRGTWTGVWILLIVLPALLLFEVLDRSGAFEHLAVATDHLAPTEGRRLVLLAWVLPSFLQGIAGFGAPIAMSAPLLVRRGMAPVAAVAACLIGYQWSVTFGSMGSSYFMAEATARLTQGAARELALRTGVVLAVSALVSGLIVLRRGRREAGDLWRAIVIGLVMGGTLLAVVSVQPALGSTVAGLAGLAACWVMLPRRGDRRPGGGDLLVAALPYLVLAVTVTVGFAFPPVRSLFERVPPLAPVLPGSEAAFGFSTPDASMTPAFRPLLHPLVYVLLGVAVALVAYRRRGWWPAGATRAALGSWRKRSRRVAASIVSLTILAAVLTEAGMISALANGLAHTLGIVFVAFSAPLGAFGTVLSGSTTASNALFAALQGEVAVVLAIAPAILVAAQTAGGNIGNALAPAPAAVGTAAVDASGQEAAVLRRNLRASALLLALVTVLTILQAWLVP